MNKFFSFILVFIFGFANAQELICTVRVNTDKVIGTNQKVFKTLETSLTEFVNNTNWTGVIYKPNEKINCSMSINIESVEEDQYTASILVQSSRPGYNSTYSSPVFNFNDKTFTFKYLEFENLTFNPTNFDSNLISVVAFYSYIVIGMDQDTLSKNGGSDSFAIAQNVANLAQSSGYKGWTQDDKAKSRYYLINDLLSPTFSPFRDAMYEYHYLGIDKMYKDTKLAKENIILAVNELKIIHELRPNSFLARVFFDAKSDEIISIFTGGPKIPTSDFVYNLNMISPLNSSKWATIKD